MDIKTLVLGAGQEIGKSCVVVSMNGKRIMFDCGMHKSYVDHRRYPDFSLISPSGNFDDELSCIIITHVHLDHIGALVYFTEVCGYRGLIYMTYPTKALAPMMLEDYRKLMVDRGEEEQFTSDHIAECMKKVTVVDLRQTVQVDEDLQIRAYYAGHVIGAAMFYAKVGNAEIVYTGDYNMTPERHLGAAQIDRLRLDLLITESTFGTTIRADSKYVREREFLKVVHKCVSGGGKVLIIPEFALGRTQELYILLDDYWKRMNLSNVPIYFSPGLTIQANMYYKMLISWTSSQKKIKDTYLTQHNPFDFKNVVKFDRSMIDAPGPCVLFGTSSGMNINGGFLHEVFKHWAPSENNLVILPGSVKPPDTQIDVRCQIHPLAFSAHTDSKGIMDLVKFLSPKHVILVHGEKPKMASLKERIHSELGIKCYHPANNETVRIPSSTQHYITAEASRTFTRNCLNPNFMFQKCSSVDKRVDGDSTPQLLVEDERVAAAGVLVVEKNKKAKFVHQDELLHILGEKKHEV